MSAQSIDSMADDETLVAHRAYFVGTSDEIREMAKKQSYGHTSVPYENHSELVEVRKPPPACGPNIQSAFADFCVSRLNVGLAPCQTNKTRVFCSTGYLQPESERVYWRLKYRHHAEQLSLELDVLKRHSSGRLQPTIVTGDLLQELYELLIITTRCDINL
ncbi:MAG: hypothetical protein ABW124_03845 [Candidatus Thiodiazotropha sp. 6PLUC9]